MVFKKQVKYAGFSVRLLANFIDMVITTILFIPLVKGLDFILFGNTPPRVIFEQVMISMPKDTKAPLAYVMQSPVVYDYFITNQGLTKFAINNLIQITFFAILVISLWAYKQCTPGKMLLAMKVVDADTLDKPSLRQCIIRFLSYVISFLPFMLGFTWIIFDKRKQGWHDKIANTVVIKT